LIEVRKGKGFRGKGQDTRDERKGRRGYKEVIISKEKIHCL
jgi:hypothetical protein